MSNLKTLMIVGLILFIAQIFGEDIYIVKEKVIQNYEAINTLKIDFEQTNYWIEMNTETKSQGSLYYNKEKILLEYHSPQRQTLLIEDDLIYIMDYFNNQLVITQKAPDTPSLVPVKMLEHYWESSQRVLSIAEMINISLYPQDEQDTKQITILIGRDDYKIKSIEYTDHDNNRIKLNIIQEETDIDLCPDIFSIETNPETDVIEGW